MKSPTRYRSSWQTLFCIIVPALCLATIVAFREHLSVVIVAGLVLLVVVPLVELRWDRRDAARAVDQSEQGK